MMMRTRTNHLAKLVWDELKYGAGPTLADILRVVCGIASCLWSQ
jgi:hypothetical protein